MPQITAMLVGQGFTLISAAKDWMIYQGEIPFLNRAVAIEVRVHNSEMQQFPSIYLLDEVPEEIPKPHPHIFGTKRFLCYVNKSLAYPDISNPVGSILGAIRTATAVLDDLGRGNLREDLLIEADVYWSKNEYLIDLGELPNKGDYYREAFMVRRKTAPKCWIGQSKEVFKRNYSYLGNDEDNEEYSAVLAGYFIETLLPDLPPREITNLYRFIHWIKPVSQKAYDYLMLSIGKARKNNKQWLFFNLHTKNLVIGIEFLVDEHERTKVQNIKVDLRQTYHQRWQRIFRYLPVDISANAWVSRSLPDSNPEAMPGLMGQGIALLGCGSVGGYLADFLAKEGAGQGGGKLTIVDPDILTPGNIGRHYLGASKIYQYKCIAMLLELMERYPGIDVGIKISDDEILDEHIEYDLLVDATGNITKSQYLSKLKSQGRIKPNVLFTWVVGHGLGVQSYLQRKNGACLNCVAYRESGERNSLVPPNYEVIPRNFSNSCSDWHIPFSIGAVSSCSALAAEMALTHTKSQLPALRSISLQPQAIRVEDETPEKRDGCPICNALTG